MRRGQVSLSVVEAAVGALLIVSVAAGFAIGTGGPVSSEPELDTLARDTATVLGSEPAEDASGSLLVALARSAESFDRVRESTRRRVERLLPRDVAFRLRTPHGTLGYPRPPSVTTGSTTVPTRHGPVTVWVWYG